MQAGNKTQNISDNLLRFLTNLLLATNNRQKKIVFDIKKLFHKKTFPLDPVGWEISERNSMGNVRLGKRF